MVGLATIMSFPGAAEARSSDQQECESERESSCNSNGSDDCRDAKGPCEDNDASPQFEDSPVDISGNQFCVMPRSCSGQENDDAGTE